jgi:hypothetical protein
MPFEYSFTDDPPLVVIRGWGPVDSTMWLDALRTMLLDARFVAGTPILVDVSETEEAPGFAGLLIARHSLHMIPRSRGAFFTRRPVVFGFARHVGGPADDRVRAFTTLTDAIEWLGVKNRQ